MKKQSILNLNISSINDITKIEESCKYIDLDLTNYSSEVINYFLKNGSNYMYSEIINNKKGYVYVDYEIFARGEHIIDLIYQNMPQNLNELAKAKYLYISLGSLVGYDINTDIEKNDDYSYSFQSTTDSIWGTLAKGKCSNISIVKIYYYLCKISNINCEIIKSENDYYNKIIINNTTLIIDLYKDIPYIQSKFKTKYFSNYNDDIELDKTIRYIKNNYCEVLIDESLKELNFNKENILPSILNKTQNIIDITNIEPSCLSIIYNLIFTKYCPDYNISINNLYLNDIYNKHDHFILISHNKLHYSYNYKTKSFIQMAHSNIINNIEKGRIGIYLNEKIPNINERSD